MSRPLTLSQMRAPAQMRAPGILMLGGVLGGVLGLAISAQAALGANNWSPAPAHSPAQKAPTYIDTPKSSAALWGTARNGGAVYAPDDLDARLSGAAPRPVPTLQTPRPAPAGRVDGSATPSPYGNRQPRPYRNLAPYADARPYGGTSYSGLPYGGAPGQYPYNNSNRGPFGSGLPSGGFPFFGFSPFGFW